MMSGFTPTVDEFSRRGIDTSERGRKSADVGNALAHSNDAQRSAESFIANTKAQIDAQNRQLQDPEQKFLKTAYNANATLGTLWANTDRTKPWSYRLGQLFRNTPPGAALKLAHGLISRGHENLTGALAVSSRNTSQQEHDRVALPYRNAVHPNMSAATTPVAPVLPHVPSSNPRSVINATLPTAYEEDVQQDAAKDKDEAYQRMNAASSQVTEAHATDPDLKSVAPYTTAIARGSVQPAAFIPQVLRDHARVVSPNEVSNLQTAAQKVHASYLQANRGYSPTGQKYDLSKPAIGTNLFESTSHMSRYYDPREADAEYDSGSGLTKQQHRDQFFSQLTNHKIAGINGMAHDLSVRTNRPVADHEKELATAMYHEGRLSLEGYRKVIGAPLAVPPAHPPADLPSAGEQIHRAGAPEPYSTALGYLNPEIDTTRNVSAQKIAAAAMPNGTAAERQAYAKFLTQTTEEGDKNVPQDLLNHPDFQRGGANPIPEELHNTAAADALTRSRYLRSTTTALHNSTVNGVIRANRLQEIPGYDRTLLSRVYDQKLSPEDRRKAAASLQVAYTKEPQRSQLRRAIDENTYNLDQASTPPTIVNRIKNFFGFGQAKTGGVFQKLKGTNVGNPRSIVGSMYDGFTENDPTKPPKDDTIPQTSSYFKSSTAPNRSRARYRPPPQAAPTPPPSTNTTAAPSTGNTTTSSTAPSTKRNPATVVPTNAPAASAAPPTSTTPSTPRTPAPQRGIVKATPEGTPQSPATPKPPQPPSKRPTAVQVRPLSDSRRATPQPASKVPDVFINPLYRDDLEDGDGIEPAATSTPQRDTAGRRLAFATPPQSPAPARANQSVNTTRPFDSTIRSDTTRPFDSTIPSNTTVGSTAKKRKDDFDDIELPTAADTSASHLDNLSSDALDVSMQRAPSVHQDPNQTVIARPVTSYGSVHFDPASQSEPLSSYRSPGGALTQAINTQPGRSVGTVKPVLNMKGYTPQSFDPQRTVHTSFYSSNHAPPKQTDTRPSTYDQQLGFKRYLDSTGSHLQPLTKKEYDIRTAKSPTLSTPGRVYTASKNAPTVALGTAGPSRNFAVPNLHANAAKAVPNGYFYSTRRVGGTIDAPGGLDAVMNEKEHPSVAKEFAKQAFPELDHQALDDGVSKQQYSGPADINDFFEHAVKHGASVPVAYAAAQMVHHDRLGNVLDADGKKAGFLGPTYRLTPEDRTNIMAKQKDIRTRLQQMEAFSPGLKEDARLTANHNLNLIRSNSNIPDPLRPPPNAQGLLGAGGGNRGTQGGYSRPQPPSAAGFDDELANKVRQPRFDPLAPTTNRPSRPSAPASTSQNVPQAAPAPSTSTTRPPPSQTGSTGDTTFTAASDDSPASSSTNSGSVAVTAKGGKAAAPEEDESPHRSGGGTVAPPPITNAPQTTAQKVETGVSAGVQAIQGAAQLEDDPIQGISNIAGAALSAATLFTQPSQTFVPPPIPPSFAPTSQVTVSNANNVGIAPEANALFST